MKVRKIPMRLCTGCGQSFSKKELIRIVRTPEGEVKLDVSGKAPGRGAYICKSAECLKKARKNKRMDRSFETKIPDEVFDGLEKKLAALG